MRKRVPWPCWLKHARKSAQIHRIPSWSQTALLAQTTVRRKPKKLPRRRAASQIHRTRQTLSPTRSVPLGRSPNHPRSVQAPLLQTVAVVCELQAAKVLPVVVVRTTRFAAAVIRVPPPHVSHQLLPNGRQHLRQQTLRLPKTPLTIAILPAMPNKVVEVLLHHPHPRLVWYRLFQHLRRLVLVHINHQFRCLQRIWVDIHLVFRLEWIWWLVV